MNTTKTSSKRSDVPFLDRIGIVNPTPTTATMWTPAVIFAFALTRFLQGWVAGFESATGSAIGKWQEMDHRIYLNAAWEYGTHAFVVAVPTGTVYAIYGLVLMLGGPQLSAVFSPLLVRVRSFTVETVHDVVAASTRGRLIQTTPKINPDSIDD
jgi:hypothetical protein